MALVFTGGLEGLPIQLGKYAKSLYKFHRNSLYAIPDIDMLRKEVRVFCSIVVVFNESTKEIQSQTKEKIRKRELDRMIVEQTTEAYRRIKMLLKRLEPLQESSKSNLLEKLFAMMRWNLSKEEIQIPIVTLASVKSSLQLLLSLLLMDKNVSKIQYDPTLTQDERKSLLSTM